MTISDKDFEDLKDCKIGDCVLKLDADGVQSLRADVDWGKPTGKADATALFRRLALQYVTGYREGGNARLGIHRDRERPTFVADETVIASKMLYASHYFWTALELRVLLPDPARGRAALTAMKTRLESDAQRTRDVMSSPRGDPAPARSEPKW